MVATAEKKTIRELLLTVDLKQHSRAGKDGPPAEGEGLTV